MKPAIFPARGAGRLGELALWTGASALVLAVHIGAAAAILHKEPAEAGDNAPPAAIMIELAAEPEAVETEEEQITEDTESSQEVESASLQPVEEPPPEPVPEPEPVEPPPPEEIAEPVEPPPPEEPVELPEPEPEITETIPEPVEEIDPIETQMLAALENVEVPLPVSRPPPVEKKVEVKKDPPKKTVRKPPPQASKAAEKAKVQARQSDRTAARQTTAGSSRSSVSPAKWQSRLMAHLERRKRYPASAKSKGQQGTAYVRFQIDNGGNVTSISLSRSSGHAALDQEVVSMVKRASPVPAPPPGASKTIVAPVSFTLR